MQELGVPADTVTFNAAISACEKAGRTDEALLLLQRMDEVRLLCATALPLYRTTLQYCCAKRVVSCFPCCCDV
jgi:pentatricopeptide repeat protein